METSNLGVRRGGRWILSDVSLCVPSGTVLGLLGPNGSGKSTFLRAVSGVSPATSGRVWYDHDELTAMPRPEVARRVAVMSQEHSEEFEITVIDLVLLGRIPHGRGFGRDRQEDIAMAHSCLAQVGAEHLVERIFSTLSGGERQRVLFARALAQDTPVLILDEPTNHLDIAHQLELLDLVQASGRTALVALHDLNLAAHSCDALAILKDGRLISYGPPQDILNARLVRSVFGVDSTTVNHPRTGRKHFLFDARASHDDSLCSRFDARQSSDALPVPDVMPACEARPTPQFDADSVGTASMTAPADTTVSPTPGSQEGIPTS
ncbi:ABC transporter ATP-binding protein [Devriesea agamarum]|uniref:ABC transporter ATP-binding protein n=1 Tax=Devriesea agamarum TaxID=472569 RepID=UPI001E3FBEB7|nr:ABC transporter ATP-binding protein [Devriesea agamarum]